MIRNTEAGDGGAQYTFEAPSLWEPNAGIPAALRKKRLRVGHFQDFAKGSPLVIGVLIIGFDDAISNPVAEVARLFSGAVLKPGGEIGLVFVGDESHFDFFFASRCRRSEVQIRDFAGNELGREFGRTFDQG